MATKYENVVIFSLNVSHLPQKLAKNQRNSYILCINVAILLAIMELLRNG